VTQLGGCGPRRRGRVCGVGVVAAPRDKSLRERLRSALRASGSTVDGVELERLAALMEHSQRRRDALHRLWSKERLASAKEDILRLILEARDAGNRDEALWRAFVAAHVGRESASKEADGQIESGHRLICAFGSQPRWTWVQLSRDPQSLRHWLTEHRDDLRRLSFGNHRKFEAKKPELFWKVIESLISLVADRGGSPSALFDTDPSLTPQQRFALLYKRLQPLRRFGRTGRFDFLMLLGDMKLLKVEPDSCYIAGSTGPKNGAKRLWGRSKKPRELGRLADELAAKLRLSPLIVEAALCNWQKG
jgi:hypothetical protein